MKKITQGSQSITSHVGTLTVLAAIVSAGLLTQAYAYSPITSQLDPGDRGANVTSLQDFLSGAPSIYPEGLVTGYFGSLTKAGVMRFQAEYGFDQVGRVGPMTLSKINSMIATGGWVTADTAGPAFYNVAKTISNTSATFSLVTNENTMAHVVYNTSPLMFNEGNINSNGFGAIGGLSVNSYNGLGTSHSFTIPNLQPNTTYYYTIVATDAAGNVSVLGPNNAFRTNTQ